MIHTSDHLDLLDKATAAGLPVTSPARTLIDLAAMTPTTAMTAALDGALRDGLISESFLTGGSQHCAAEVATESLRFCG